MAKVKRYLPVDQVKASVWIRPALLEDCRKAVAFLGPQTEGYSFTRLLDDALTRELRRLSVKYRGGRPFPPRQGELKRGARAQTS